MTRPPILAAVVAAAVVASPAPALAPAGATAAIATYNDGVLATMKAGGPLRARTDRFQALVAGSYDMAGIAALVVGPAWAGAPAPARAAMIAALTRHSAVQLAQNFDRFTGQRFVVDPAAQTRGDSVIAKVTVAPGGDVLYFRLRQAGGRWRIVDVISGGVSQLAVQRADLASTVAAGGVAAAAKRIGEIDAKTLAGG